MGGETGKVATEQLGPILRALGNNLTEVEVLRLTNLYDNDGVGTLDYNEFHRYDCSFAPRILLSFLLPTFSMAFFLFS